MAHIFQFPLTNDVFSGSTESWKRTKVFRLLNEHEGQNNTLGYKDLKGICYVEDIGGLVSLQTWQFRESI